MTFNIGTIQGGTNAGIRPAFQTPVSWDCSCGTHNERYWGTCKECNAKRK